MPSSHRQFGHVVATVVAVALAIGPRVHAKSLDLDAGPLQLKVHVSRTAHLFHVVDQLSAWSEFCHGQYRDAMKPLNAADSAMLARHAAVRAERSWGQGLEQTFYTTLSLDDAIARGIRNGWLTEAQAKVEREVFAHFAGRVDNLMAAEHKNLARFQRHLHKQLPHLRALSIKLSRFCHGASPDIPVYLMANPHDRNHGGGFNGDILTLEVPRVRDAYPVFVHEAMHAFLKAQHDRVEAAVAGVEGLNGQTLNEGICHALAPGLLHAEGKGADPLRRSALEGLKRGDSLERSDARYRRYALALRPLLSAALDDKSQTLETFLPRAIDIWRVLVTLDGFYTAND